MHKLLFVKSYGVVSFGTEQAGIVQRLDNTTGYR